MEFSFRLPSSNSRGFSADYSFSTRKIASTCIVRRAPVKNEERRWSYRFSKIARGTFFRERLDKELGMSLLPCYREKKPPGPLQLLEADFPTFLLFRVLSISQCTYTIHAKKFSVLPLFDASLLRDSREKLLGKAVVTFRQCEARGTTKSIYVSLPSVPLAMTLCVYDYVS